MSKQPENALRKYKRIPVYIVEEHNDALQFIYGAIGGKRLPVEGNTLIHLDSHPDMMVDRTLRGDVARSGREVLPQLSIENWILPAAAAGHISHVVWLRPPWANQLADGTRIIKIGDEPTTGFLRVSSSEPYYLSDALYCSNLINEKTFQLSVAELGDPDHTKQNEEKIIQNMVEDFKVNKPYVLDIDLDFFSTENPFLLLYNRVNLYDRLETIYKFQFPNGDSNEAMTDALNRREQQLQELELLFKFLKDNKSLKHWSNDRTDIFHQVDELSKVVVAEYGPEIDWEAIHWAGCTRDQGGLPVHRSSRRQIENLVNGSLASLLRALPPPVLITIARSSRDEYCPQDQVDEIQEMVLKKLKEILDIDEPVLYYLDE